MAHREGRFLLLQVYESLKILSMNLFGTWEVGAPKVGTPSSHVTSLGPFFIGDTPNSFWLRFLGELERRDVKIIKKKSKKNLKKKKGEFEWQKLLKEWWDF